MVLVATTTGTAVTTGGFGMNEEEDGSNGDGDGWMVVLVDAATKVAWSGLVIAVAATA